MQLIHAEVPPDFAIAKIQHAQPEIQIFLAAEYRTSKVFHTLKSAFSPLFTGISVHFPHAKKNEIGI